MKRQGSGVIIALMLILCVSITGAEENNSDKYAFDNYGGEEFTPQPMEFGESIKNQEKNSLQAPSKTGKNATERKHVVLQFYANPNEEQRGLLEEYGVQFVLGAGTYSYIVSMPASLTPADLPAESGLRWMGEFPVENKYNSLNVPDWARVEDEKVELEIRFYEDVSSQEALNIANKYSSSIPDLLYHATNNDPIVYGIITEESNITSIASEDIVEFVYSSEPPSIPEDDGMVDNHQSPGFQFIYGLLFLTIAFFCLKRRGFNNE